MRPISPLRVRVQENDRDARGFHEQVERVVMALHDAAARVPGSTVAPREGALPPAPAPGPRIARLGRALDLDGDELGLLWTGIALTCDPRALPFAEILVGTDARRGVSVALYAAAAGLASERARQLAARLAADHPLVEHGLLVPVSGGGAFAAHEVPVRVLRHLAGDDRVDAALVRVGGTVAVPDEPVLDAAGAALVAGIDEALAGGDLVLIEGTPGSGRRTLAALAGQKRMREIVFVDVAKIPADPAAMRACLTALARERVLRGAVPLLVLPSGTLPHASALATFLDGPGSAVLIGEPGCDPAINRRIVRMRVPAPGIAQRRQLWQHALGGAADGVTAELAVRFKVSPGVIADVGGGARRRGETEINPIAHAVRRGMADRLAGVADRIEVTQGWDDLILPVDTHDQVRALVARCRNQHQVLEAWGFGRKLARGQGVAALFSGPPGTGKTMVAGLIARELDLELYQVDLSRVVSKWVGETEKQLGRVFDAAEAGHVVLLFDEADALFGRRGEAQGAQDRWANLEVNYLLQRIEAFGGICILTTNLDGSLDPAFRRRLAAHVPFWAPGAEERALLWRRMLPPEAPVADDIDLDHLAEEYPELSGAHIRNAVVAAAFLASTEGPGARITAEHLERAARAEYRSMGHLLGQGAS